MLGRALARSAPSTSARLAAMAAHMSNGSAANGSYAGASLADLPKSANFTAHLPTDQQYPTPEASHKAPRDDLGPRMVKDAYFTYVRPEAPTGPTELLGVSPAAMRDLGLAEGEQRTQDFADMTSGRRVLTWDEQSGKGAAYPWAQCYGGFQFGNWAAQLGDGRAISLFESTNPKTGTRYEIQLKGAGRTPYSRFADGKAVLRSSLREYVVSESLHALGIPTTRALALTLLPDEQVHRERIEPGAIVTRFAESWLRIGTFDLQRARGNRDGIRKLADYVAEEVFGGWDQLPRRIPVDKFTSDSKEPLAVSRGAAKADIEGSSSELQENRYVRLYREIVRRNAKTVAKWQAYAFTNGVLNTDNTSIFGLSVDFGPFAFLDNFDPAYTPNHDDFMLRYSYRNQPTIIWWNLVRLGEDLGELLGSGERADDEEFVQKGITEEYAPTLIKRAESAIERAGEEYKAVFLDEYKRLMAARLGLKTQKSTDFDKLISELLDTLEALELDFHHAFRRLSSVTTGATATHEHRKDVASRFLHHEGISKVGTTEDQARERLAKWLESWRTRVMEDWGGSEEANAEREAAMKRVNPKFVPRGWILSELIERVEKKGERDVLERIMQMALHPFEESWGGDKEEEERWCGDVPRYSRGEQCSCSS